MKQLFLSVTAIATIMSASAFSADLPSIKSATVDPAPVWTGFYAGLNAGYGFGTNNSTIFNKTALSSSGLIEIASSKYFESLPLISGDISNTQQNGVQSGFIGGGQIGYNYQFNQFLVAGIETDFQGSLIQKNSDLISVFGSEAYGLTRNQYGGGALVTINQAGFGVNSVSTGINYFGTLRARIGYLIDPSFLIYCTAGLAYGDVWANVSSNNYSNNMITIIGSFDPPVSQIFTGKNENNKLLAGYSAGGGIEWMINNNWSLKAEALYWNLGNINMSSSSIGLPTVGAPTPVYDPTDYWQGYTNLGLISGNYKINYQGVIARAGVNYHFDFGRAVPVVAKF